MNNAILAVLNQRSVIFDSWTFSGVGASIELFDYAKMDVLSYKILAPILMDIDLYDYA